MKHFLTRLESRLLHRNLRYGLIVFLSVAALLACAPTRAATPEHAPQTPPESIERPSTGAAQPAPSPQTRALSRQTAPAKTYSVAELEARARKREIGEQKYPYHAQSRKVRGKVKCPTIELIDYEGALIAYNRPIKINTYFKDRLIRFERIVAQVAVQVYGRAPARIIHAGGYSCKTVGGRGKVLSEHVFGHAIDISGFEFEAAHAPDAEASDQAFTITLKKHWNAQKGLGAMHSRFLHKLTEALKKRGPFSLMLGPAYKGHDALFHFDFGPQFFFRI